MLKNLQPGTSVLVHNLLLRYNAIDTYTALNYLAVKYCATYVCVFYCCRMEQDTRHLSLLMREHIKDKIEPAVLPFLQLKTDRGNEVMAVLLDPRFCKGGLFRSLADSAAAARELFKGYTETLLIPAAVHLKQFYISQNAAPDERNTGDDNSPEVQPDEDDCMDSDDDEEADATDVATIERAVRQELKNFRKDKDLPTSATDNKVDPLKWWAKHAAQYPLLAPLVRIVFSCPGSQIECERVFSLAGLLTSSLRNRMSPERLGDVVFIAKNLDLASELEDMLGTYYGADLYSAAACEFEQRSESADAADLVTPAEAGEHIDWLAIETLLAEAEPLFEEM